MKRNPYVLGIDLGGTNIKGAIVDQQGKVAARKEIPTLAESGPEGVAERIVRLALELQKDTGISADQLIGLGMGVPGQIDCTTGCVLRSGNLRWQDVFIVDMVKRELKLPAFIENDATAAAMGEKWCGAGRQANNFVMLTIGTGIGGGIIVNGELYRGTLGTAGEIGHMVIEAGGPQCSCGNKGCLEALTAAPAILRRARTVLEKNKNSLLAGNSSLEVRDVFRAAEQGDSAALKIIDETAYFLGVGIGNLINIFNPEIVAVGGGISKGGELLFKPLVRYAEANSLKVPWSSAKILPAELGNDAGFLGAAAVAFLGLGIKPN